jgi:hypothetical protein
MATRRVERSWRTATATEFLRLRNELVAAATSNDVGAAVVAFTRANPDVCFPEGGKQLEEIRRIFHSKGSGGDG